MSWIASRPVPIYRTNRAWCASSTVPRTPPRSASGRPYDGAGRAYAPLALTLGGGEAANLTTWDIELGNPSKGLAGSAGPGAGGVWRLEISGDGDIEVLAYVRAPNGLLNPLPGDAETKDKAR